MARVKMQESGRCVREDKSGSLRDLFEPGDTICSHIRIPARYIAEFEYDMVGEGERIEILSKGYFSEDYGYLVLFQEWSPNAFWLLRSKIIAWLNERAFEEVKRAAFLALV